MLPKLTRIYNRYVGETATVAEARDAILREAITQMLPPSAATLVHSRNFTTAREIAAEADAFFEDRKSYPEHPKWQKKPFSPPTQEKVGPPQQSNPTSSFMPLRQQRT